MQPGEPAAFLCAVMARGADAVDTAVAQLALQFGAVQARSRTWAFDMSAYYEAEMGPGLAKGLVWLGDPIDPERLAGRKRQMLTFEGERAVEGPGGELRRTVNVDPGLLSEEGLVLATSKARGHRVAIAAGLWAEVTLLFEGGEYRPLPWTYPDYRGPEVREFLVEVRGRLRELRRGRGSAATGGAP